jgi:hypothetical protein
MDSKFLDVLARSFTLVPQPDRRQQTDRRKTAGGGRRITDQRMAMPRRFPPCRTSRSGVARRTWVYHHDTLEEQYVN